MRRKFVQDHVTGKIREVDPNTYVPVGRNLGATDRLVSESHYEGMRATDGTPIDSRKKHQQYMRENGLAHFHDFSDDFRAKVAHDNERQRRKELKQTIIDTVNRMENNGR